MYIALLEKLSRVSFDFVAHCYDGLSYKWNTPQ